MPDKNAVIWLNSADEISVKIKRALETTETLKSVQHWFEIINQQPSEISSNRIWDSIEKISN
jgi:hypothetical protein